MEKKTHIKKMNFFHFIFSKNRYIILIFNKVHIENFSKFIYFSYSFFKHLE